MEPRTVLVTGGTSGIGEAIVRRFSAEGYRVAFCGRREAPGRALQEALQAEGREVLFLRCDVADEAQVEALVSQTLDWGGRLDAAVNCAGISPPRARLSESTLEAYEKVFAINVRGTFLAMKHQLRVMEEQRSGAIVNVASVLGIRAVDLNHGLYTAAKHAVVGLTKTAALEGARLGIRVNVLCPGVIETPIHTTNAPTAEALGKMVGLHPLGRLGNVDEVAAAAVWLASPEASFVTGAVLTVDGGASL